jgi:transposase
LRVLVVVPHLEQLPRSRVSSRTTGCAGCAKLLSITVFSKSICGPGLGCWRTRGATGLSNICMRWLEAGVFEAVVHDLRVLLRLSEGRASEPTAAIRDSRTLHSTPESGSRGGYHGAKRKKGPKVHAAVDTLGHLLALFISPAGEQERAWVGELAGAIQEATGESVELAYADLGYTGERVAKEAEAHDISLEMVKHPEAKRGFVLLPRRRDVERDFAWISRFRRLVKSYERLPNTLAQL